MFYNRFVCLLLLIPALAIADEACEYKCSRPAGECSGLSEMTKICRPIPHFKNTPELFKDAEKIGFVGDKLFEATEKLGRSAYYCHEPRHHNAIWVCSRPIGLSDCGTQIQTIILDMVPAEENHEPEYKNAPWAFMKVGGFRALLTTNCVEEVDNLKLDLP